MNRLELFLKELSELTKKHGFSIGGCGCCGSPYIDDFKNEFDAVDLGYDESTEEYSVRIRFNRTQKEKNSKENNNDRT